jgi:RecB family exonuclease
MLDGREGSGSSPEDSPAAAASYAPPVPRTPPLPETWSVTAFRAWLGSPYLFYVRHVLKRETVEDAPRELDPRLFGILAHAVVEKFGKDPDVHGSTRADQIAEYLSDTLRTKARKEFGEKALAAVSMQVEQLDWRFELFAAKQAKRAQDGWRIAHVEWPGEKRTFPFDVDGEEILIRGRIDRIDEHAQHGLAILDYKTGDEVKSPESVHGGGSAKWKDLQLPLYRHIAAEVTGDRPVQLGYAVLGKDDANIGFKIAKKWNEEFHDSALEKAREIVRTARTTTSPELGTPGELMGQPVLRGLLGIGIEPASQEEEEEA